MINILYKIIRDVDKHLLKESGVYQIKNKNNNKVYIGSTSGRFSKRLTSHIRELIEYRHHSKHLQNCFNKNPNFEYFEISILEVCSSDQCLEREQFYLDLYKPYDDKFGYNISPTAASCLGIKKSEEEKIIIFERMRKLSDDQVIEIFKLRNELKLNNEEISKIIGISKNYISSVLTRSEKYKYVKEKYNLKLEVKHTKKFNREDVLKIFDLYENQRLSIMDIKSLTSFETIPLRHLIYNDNLYREEKDGLIFNVEKNRKNKIYKINRKSGYKINKNIIDEKKIYDFFEMKYVLNLTNNDICEKLKINLREVDLISSFSYQRRKYNQIYLDIKTKYRLRKSKITLSDEDIKNIFKDYNSGEYLIEDLNKKYKFSDVGIILSGSSKRLSKHYKEIIEKNNFIVNKRITKNSELKSKSIIDRNKNRLKTYKLITPDGEELIVKNLSEFCKDKELDSANLSRVSKNGKKHKGWSCFCLD
jgi:hypothetical protein